MSTEISKLNPAMEKIAKMEAAGVNPTEIQTMFNLSSEQFDKIQNMGDYQVLVTELKQTSIETQLNIAEGWDGVESFALTTVLDTLMNSPDPDYALRAAAIANKASRASRRGNRSGTLHPDSMQAVITLNPTFVQNIQQNNLELNDNKLLDYEQKGTNMLSIQKVKDLLATDVDSKQAELNTFAQQIFASV